MVKRTVRIAILLTTLPAILQGQVYLTKEEALKLYFPHAMSIERKTIFLTDEQVQKIQHAAKTKVESKIVTYYQSKGKNGVEGYAFFETQIVRTMPETFMVVVDTGGAIRAVEILAFYEPEDYLPPKQWLAIFKQKKLSDNLWVKRGLPNISGATITTQAISDGVRKILATFTIAIPKETPG